MKRLQLRSKDVAQELEQYGFSITKKDIIEKIEDTITVLLINSKPSFFYYHKKIIPTLKLLQERPLLKIITVDMGAVKHIINGADIMRPGIKLWEEGMQQGDVITIVDITHKKPLAVGIALVSSAQLRSTSTGKAVKNIHYVGDATWNFQL